MTVKAKTTLIKLWTHISNINSMEALERAINMEGNVADLV